MKRVLIVILSLLLIGCSGADKDNLSQYDGYYEGYFMIGDNRIPMTMVFAAGDEVSGLIDIEVQNAYDLAIEDIRFKDNRLNFSIPLGQSRGYFEGYFDINGYSGEYVQGGLTLPFAFTKTERPNTDHLEAFSYHGDGYELTGEMMVPEKGHAVALIIAGSGMTDMNGNSSAGVYTNTYKYIAEALYEHDIASLRYNKRTVGNVIDESGILFDDFVDDARALTQALLDDSRFSEVYLIGHSQGALIAQLVAADLEVDKVVMIAGAGRTIDEILLEQFKEQVNESDHQALKKILEKNKLGEVVSDVPRQMSMFAEENMQRFMISWIQHDPKKLMDLIEEDILLVYGTEDLQVPVEDGQALHQVGGQLIVVEGMNHVLKTTSSSYDENIKTYQNVELPLNKVFIEKLVEFLN